eukprot:2529916-Rhodomonas_salina.1
MVCDREDPPPSGATSSVTRGFAQTGSNTITECCVRLAGILRQRGLVGGICNGSEEVLHAAGGAAAVAGGAARAALARGVELLHGRAVSLLHRVRAVPTGVCAVCDSTTDVGRTAAGR